MTTPLYTCEHPSPLGRLTIVASDAGLRAVLWPDDDRIEFAVEPDTRPDHPVLVAATEQLDEYFAGARTRFDLPLDLCGTAFQVEAWRSLTSVPYGETSTYGEQAARLGRPNASRAVGAANGRNPVSIVLPCHRIVGTDGSLTGFAGGLDAKRYLLELEAG